MIETDTSDEAFYAWYGAYSHPLPSIIIALWTWCECRRRAEAENTKLRAENTKLRDLLKEEALKCY